MDVNSGEAFERICLLF